MFQAHLMPRHQLLPGLLNDQAAVAALSNLPVPPFLRGQAGHPKHAECMQPHLQLAGLADFLGEPKRGLILGTQTPSLGMAASAGTCVRVCVRVCVWEWEVALSLSGDTEAWGQKGVAGTQAERQLGLQKTCQTEESD